MVYKVLMDSDRNRARGVLYIYRISRKPKEVRARAVVLCAQSLESVRILLNSANTQYPNGLANSSGVLGLSTGARRDSGKLIKKLFWKASARWVSIMTLCVRSMDYLMGEMKRGNV
jgi:choline dehydrogenase-like flavoprotein